LVSTTGEFRNLFLETTRFLPPLNPKIRRLPAAVEKVGLEDLFMGDSVRVVPVQCRAWDDGTRISNCGFAVADGDSGGPGATG
jgi:hypothetical protein